MKTTIFQCNGCSTKPSGCYLIRDSPYDPMLPKNCPWSDDNSAQWRKLCPNCEEKKVEAITEAMKGVRG